MYPRASGGTAEAWKRTGSQEGVSPRERGNLRLGPDVDRFDGCIPARAGEPVEICHRAVPYWVYPRASGGTRRAHKGLDDGAGVSPRERGNLVHLTARAELDGCIPARAGEPGREEWTLSEVKVYPRASGGTNI